MFSSRFTVRSDSRSKESTKPSGAFSKFIHSIKPHSLTGARLTKSRNGPNGGYTSGNPSSPVQSSDGFTGHELVTLSRESGYGNPPGDYAHKCVTNIGGGPSTTSHNVTESRVEETGDGLSVANPTNTNDSSSPDESSTLSVNFSKEDAKQREERLRSEYQQTQRDWRNYNNNPPSPIPDDVSVRTEDGTGEGSDESRFYSQNPDGSNRPASRSSAAFGAFSGRAWDDPYADLGNFPNFDQSGNGMHSPSSPGSRFSVSSSEEETEAITRQNSTQNPVVQPVSRISSRRSAFTLNPFKGRSRSASSKAPSISQSRKSLADENSDTRSRRSLKSTFGPWTTNLRKTFARREKNLSNVHVSHAEEQLYKFSPDEAKSKLDSWNQSVFNAEKEEEEAPENQGKKVKKMKVWAGRERPSGIFGEGHEQAAERTSFGSKPMDTEGDDASKIRWLQSECSRLQAELDAETSKLESIQSGTFF